MGRRVDEPRRVQIERHAQEDAPEQDRPAAGGQEHHAEHDERHVIQFLEPAVHGVFHQVGGETRAHLPVVTLRRARQNPAHVRPPAPVPRRVRVARRVRVRVVNAVRHDPGDGPGFEGQQPAEGEQVLERLRRFEAAVRQQPVVAHADAEAPGHPPEQKARGERLPVEHEERRHRPDMENDHRHVSRPIDAGLSLNVSDRFVTHSSSLPFPRCVPTL